MCDDRWLRGQSVDVGRWPARDCRATEGREDRTCSSVTDDRARFEGCRGYEVAEAVVKL